VPEIYRSEVTEASTDQPAVFVVHCSDPRYQPHFQVFIREGLGIQRYGLVAIPGGVQTLTLMDYLPKFAWSGWRWVKFMVNLTRPDRVVLISHDDCRWYLENRFADSLTAREKQIGDLRRVRAQFVERFGPVRVELYFATLSGTHAGFEAL
jgi:hypothetical protein